MSDPRQVESKAIGKSGFPADDQETRMDRNSVAPSTDVSRVESTSVQADIRNLRFVRQPWAPHYFQLQVPRRAFINSTQTTFPMAKYIFTGTDSDGNTITERIEAATLSGARYKLETQGFTKIVFHTDDMAASIDASMKSRNDEEVDDEFWTAEDELAARQSGGVLSGLWFAWKANSLFWMPLLIWNTVSFIEGRPYSIWDWIGFGLSVLFLVYFVWIALPGMAYQRLLQAVTWHRWAELRLWLGFLRLMRRFAFIPFPDMELDFREGLVHAANGKMEKALAVVQKHENAATGKYLYWSRLASLYEAAGQFDTMTDCMRTAAQHGTGAAAEKLDIAMGLLRRHRNVAEARPILDEVAEEEASDLVRIFLLYCQGMLAVEEGQWKLAEERLQASLREGAAYMSNPLMTGLNSEINAYLAIAVASQGQYDTARQIIRGIEGYLKATKETALLDRCKACLL